jgi:hypothetical protein
VVYHPPRALGLLAGSVLTLWAAGIGVLLLNHGITSDLGVTALVTYAAAMAAALLAMVFGYWTYGLATLSYELDRNGLVINWIGTRQIVPLGAIERLVPGTSVGVPRVRGVSWLGYHVGRATIERIGEVLFYSTHQAPEHVLYVMTAERNYAISVDDPASFARDIQVRQDLGPTAEVTHHVERRGISAVGFLIDRTAIGLALLALAAGGAVWLLISVRYPSLPATLELSIPPVSDNPLVEVTTKDALLELPRVASLLLVINLVGGIALHLWDRLASYVLLIAATAIQLGFIVAIQLLLRDV